MSASRPRISSMREWRHVFRGVPLNGNPFDFIERNLILPAVIEFRRPGGLVVGDVLRRFELAIVLQVGGDAGRAERVVADLGLDAGGPGAPLNHPVGVLLPHRVPGESAGLAGRRPEEGLVRV